MPKCNKDMPSGMSLFVASTYSDSLGHHRLPVPPSEYSVRDP